MAWCWCNATESKPQNVSNYVKMREEGEIEFIRKYNRFPNSSFWYYFKAIGLLSFSLICIAIFIFVIREVIFTDKFNDQKRWPIFPFIIIIGYFGISILSGLKKEINSNRFFKVVNTKKSKEDNFEIASEIIQKYFSYVEINNKKSDYTIMIKTQPNLLTWGEKITVVCDENRILVNSRSTKFQFYSYGKNTKNVIKFENKILSNLTNHQKKQK